MMKIKFIIGLSLISLLYYSCCKEKKSASALTAKDLKYLPYTVGDTLHFKEIYNDGEQNGYCEDTIKYYVVSRQQNNDKLTIICRIENTAENAHFILKKENNKPVIDVDYYDFNPYDSIETGLDLHIGGFNLEKYNAIELDSITYTNVYKNESDTSLNSQHCMYIKRVYYNKNRGIIRIEQECYAYNIY